MTATALFIPYAPAAPLPGLLDDPGRVGTPSVATPDRAALAARTGSGHGVLADVGIAAIVPRPAVGGSDKVRPNGCLVRSRDDGRRPWTVGGGRDGRPDRGARSRLEAEPCAA